MDRAFPVQHERYRLDGKISMAQPGRGRSRWATNRFGEHKRKIELEHVDV